MLRAVRDPNRPAPSTENPNIGSPLHELVAAISELIAGQAALLRAVAQALDALESPRAPRTARGNDIGSRGFLADREQEEERKNPPPLPPQLVTRKESGKKPRKFPRGAARIADLLSPLHEVVERRGLVPLHDFAPIAAAIATYDDTAVREMVDAIERETSTGGSVVRSPFGLLVSRARGVEPHRNTRSVSSGARCGAEGRVEPCSGAGARSVD